MPGLYSSMKPNYWTSPIEVDPDAYTVRDTRPRRNVGTGPILKNSETMRDARGVEEEPGEKDKCTRKSKLNLSHKHDESNRRKQAR